MMTPLPRILQLYKALQPDKMLWYVCEKQIIQLYGYTQQQQQQRKE